MPDLDYLQNCLGQRGIPEAYTFLLGKTKNVMFLFQFYIFGLKFPEAIKQLQ